MRMYDIAMTDPYISPQLRGGLSLCKVISMDNVADYLIETGKNVFARDLPTIAPPFDQFFVDLVGKDRTRAWFGIDSIAKSGFFFWNCTDGSCVAREQKNTDKAIKWSVHAIWLYQCTMCDEVHIPDIIWTLNLDEFGRWANTDIPYYRFGQKNPFTNIPAKISDEELYEESMHILPALFAIGLMHAKNTSLVDTEQPPKLSKKFEKKNRRPLTSYKTIHVKPMSQVKVAADIEGDKSISARLHIARGHFKDYRQGGGLFGRYRDIFWWDSQIRGNPERGEIHSSYSVEPPEDEDE